ncbi:glyceraldehyde-3-phosphate dehydrogenase [Marivita sp.]|nr:glyceraldehyde-3-phosphate dehydrogenase [Marivita sp.]
MTNSIAIGLGLLILGGIAIDAFLTGGDGLLFLAVKGIDLVEWIAFWR